MELTEAEQNKIEAYFRGDLPEEERKSLESRVESEREFQEAFEAHKITIAALYSQHKTAQKQRIAEKMREYRNQNEGGQASSGKVIPLWQSPVFRAAAAIVLLAGVGLGIFFGLDSPEESTYTLGEKDADPVRSHVKIALASITSVMMGDQMPEAEEQLSRYFHSNTEVIYQPKEAQPIKWQGLNSFLSQANGVIGDTLEADVQFAEVIRINKEGDLQRVRIEWDQDTLVSDVQTKVKKDLKLSSKEKQELKQRLQESELPIIIDRIKIITRRLQDIRV